MTEVSREYSTALFMLAKETNSEEEISESLAVVTALLQKTPEYLDFLASPNISMKERIDAIDSSFGGRVNEYVVSFMKMVCEKGHVRDLHECIAAYRELYQASCGISTAKVISAAVMKAPEKEALKRKLESFCGHSVILECSVNKAILGGLIVHMDGKVLDGSLRRRLHDIKEVMNQ